MTVIYRPPAQRHRCPHAEWPRTDMPGTVRECDCGKTWLARQTPKGVVWRPERWWRQWRRRIVAVRGG